MAATFAEQAKAFLDSLTQSGVQLQNAGLIKPAASSPAATATDAQKTVQKNQFAEMLGNPIVLIGGAVTVVLVLILILRKR